MGFLYSILHPYSFAAVYLLLINVDYKLGFPAYDILNAFLTTCEIRKRRPDAKFWDSTALALLSMISGSIIITILLGETANVLTPDRNLTAMLLTSLATLLLPDRLFHALAHYIKDDTPFLLNVVKALVKVTSLYKVRMKITSRKYEIQYGGRVLLCLFALFWSSVLIGQFSPATPPKLQHASSSPPYKILSFILASLVTTIFLQDNLNALNFFILLFGFSFNKE